MKVFFFGMLAFVCRAAAEEEQHLTVVPASQVVYSTYKTLLVSLIGFRSESAGNMRLDFEPALSPEAYDIKISRAGSMLELTLRPDMEWPYNPSSEITKLKVKRYEDEFDLLDLKTPIEVAQIVEAPLIRDDMKVLSMTSKYLSFEGKALRNMRLTFDPPLLETRDFIFTPLLDTTTHITLRLLPNRRWRSDGLPGPLRIVAIDTGAGRISLKRQIAAIQIETRNQGELTVEERDLKMYDSASTLEIFGSGFQEPKILYFANENVEEAAYEENIDLEKNKLVLRRKESLKWREGPCVLLAIDMVPVAKNGVRVATVLKTPFVSPNPSLFLRKTTTRTVDVAGGGFTPETRLTFDPPLTFAYDYLVYVYNESSLVVQLADGHSWSKKTGPLKITSVNTGAGAIFDPVIIVYVTKDVSQMEDDDTSPYPDAEKPLVIVSGVAFAAALLGAMLLAALFSALRRKRPFYDASFEMPLYATVDGPASSFRPVQDSILVETSSEEEEEDVSSEDIDNVAFVALADDDDDDDDDETQKPGDSLLVSNDDDNNKKDNFIKKGIQYSL